MVIIISVVPQAQSPPSSRNTQPYPPSLEYNDDSANATNSPSRLPFGNVSNIQRLKATFGIAKENAVYAKLFAPNDSLHASPPTADRKPRTHRCEAKALAAKASPRPIRSPEDWQARLLSTRARLAAKFGSADFPPSSKTVIRPLPPHRSPAEVLDLIRRRRTATYEGFSDYGSVLCRQSVQYAAVEKAEKDIAAFEERFEEDRRRLFESSVAMQKARWIAGLLESGDDEDEASDAEELGPDADEQIAATFDELDQAELNHGALSDSELAEGVQEDGRIASQLQPDGDAGAEEASDTEELGFDISDDASSAYDEPGQAKSESGYLPYSELAGSASEEECFAQQVDHEKDGEGKADAGDGSELGSIVSEQAPLLFEELGCTEAELAALAMSVVAEGPQYERCDSPSCDSELDPFAEMPRAVRIERDLSNPLYQRFMRS
ncbi:hypothetical protein PENSPDRAFT_749508 [Peniophora sp. CONT]|nr:hypothetical protein PENSPDRAFT_749508 [Peniophora sp. CONT]